MKRLDSRERRRYRRVGAVVTGLYVVLCAWLVIAALEPAIPQFAHPWLAALTSPGSAWAMTLVVVLGVAGYSLFARARQVDSLRAPLLASMWAATTAIVLAMAAYLPCSGSAPTGWQALTSTIGLFIGAFDEPFGAGQACTHEVPLALHVARLADLSATLTSVLTVVASMSRTQMDRLRLSRAKSLTAVVGLDDDTVGVVAALAKQSSRRYRTVVLTGSTTEAEARAACGRVSREPGPTCYPRSLG